MCAKRWCARGGRKKTGIFLQGTLGRSVVTASEGFLRAAGGKGVGRDQKKKIAASACVRTDTLRTYTHNNFARLSVASAGGPPSRSLWWVLYCECPSQIPPPHHLTQPFPTLPPYLEADEDSKIASCERVVPLFAILTPPDTKPMFPPYQFPPFLDFLARSPLPPPLPLLSVLFCLSSVGRC